MAHDRDSVSADAVVPRLPRERFEPTRRDREQSLLVQAIDALASALLSADQARSFQHSQVPAGRWPAAAEALRDFSCRQLAATKTQHEQDVTTRSVSQRVEHRLCVRELPLGSGSRRTALAHAPLLAKFTGSKAGKSISLQSAPIGSQTDITSGLW